MHVRHQKNSNEIRKIHSEAQALKGCACKIRALAASDGIFRGISLSNLPALLRAGSKASGLLVAPAHMIHILIRQSNREIGPQMQKGGHET